MYWQPGIVTGSVNLEATFPGCLHHHHLEPAVRRMDRHIRRGTPHWRAPRPPEGTEPRQDGERERRPGRSRRLQCRGPLRRGRDPPPPSRRRRGLALYPCYDGRGRPTGLEARPERFRRATGAPLASHAPADCRTYRLASQPASPDTRTTVGTGFRPLWKRAARRSPVPSRRGNSKRCPEFGGIPENLPGTTFRIV